MTEGEIIGRAKERLDEDASVSLRYTASDLTEYVLDGARFYVARTGCQTTTTTITQDPNELMYWLPCDCIQVERVLWQGTDGKQYPLEPTLTRELDAEQGLWQRTTDTHARRYFLYGLDHIALWPISPDGGESYVVHYQQDPVPAVANVPLEDHEALVSYTLSRALLSEGKVKEGMGEYGLYAAAVKAATRRMANVDRVWAQGR